MISVGSPQAAPPTPWQVCVVATSFPRWDGDLNGRFILDEIRAMPAHLRFVVVAPSDDQSRDGEQPFPGIVVHRFRYFFPKRWQRLTGGNGIPDNLSRSRMALLNVPFFALALIWATVRCARGARVIHAHWLLSAFGAVLTRFIHRCPIVVTVRGTDLYGKNRLLRVLNRLILPRVDAVLPVAAGMAPALEALGASPSRITVLPLAMRCPSDQELAAWRERASRPADDACVRLVFVGRLARVKAVDLLLEALGQMARRGLSVRLDIVGDGAERPGLEDLVRDLGLGNTVRFVGQVPTTEVPGYLAAADVFVLCSHSEGMPYSLWEAMSFGLACVATRVGGVPELVTDGREGLLIEAGNPVALAEALGVLVRDPEQRLRLGQAARQRAVEKVRQQRSIPETLVAVYEQVLHQRSCTAQEAR